MRTHTPEFARHCNSVAHSEYTLQEDVTNENQQGWCSGRDSNSHGLRHCPLKTACLPIPPPELRFFSGSIVVLRSIFLGWCLFLKCRQIRTQVRKLLGIIGSFERRHIGLRQRLINGRRFLGLSLYSRRPIEQTLGA